MITLTSSTPPPVRAPFLDGLRGWGALVVVVYHIFVEIYPTSPRAANMLLRFALFNGTLAVVIFFIVSGFSLSVGFLESGERRRLQQILTGRYFRLAIPILMATGIAYICAKFGLILNVDRKIAAQQLLPAIRFAVFGVFFDNHDPVRTPIPQLWTMPIELLGSVIVLAFFWVVGLRHVRFRLYPLILVALCFYNPMLAAFFVGIVFAELNKRNMTGTIQPFAAFMFFFGTASAVFLPGNGYLATLVAASLITFGAIFSATGRRILSGALSRFLGEISFPLYLLHGLVIYSYGTWVIGYATTPVVRILVNTSTVFIAICIAWAFQWIDVAGIVTAHLITRRTTKFRSEQMLSRTDHPNDAGAA
ncbi:acyltransferase family protein [Paraburkholderia hospita]|uniref:acyltransferase family protein n=1 Tax=Paraburkholderia hospita TaxID=169430 RepID=UPI000B3451A0|nr:acyltransferase [Paraburkholderia hospita]OUL88690.1 hypothetical protein CA601_18165 [Paraburkholderia hospita]